MQAIDIYARYKGKVTCAYRKDCGFDSEGIYRCFAKRTEEREKYIFNGLTDDLVLIECPEDVLAIEFEMEATRNGIKQSVPKEKIKAWIEETEKNIIDKGMDYCTCDHGGKSPWIYCFNLEGLMDFKDKKLLALELIPEEAVTFLDKSNLGKTLIPIIDMPHWKPKYNGAIHKIVKGKNPLEHRNNLSWFKPEHKAKDLSIKEIPKEFLNSQISEIKIQDVINLTSFKKDSHGFNGSNPWHSSTTGTNFRVFDNGIGFCRRCNASISGIKALALNEGIIKNCDDELRGENFKKAKEKAEEKGLIEKQKPNTVFEDIKAAKESQESDDSDWMSIKDYLNYKENNEYIIKDLLYPTEISMLYAPSGHMKSLFMLYVALCLVYGKKCLGKKTRPHSAGILSAENGISTDAKRIKAIMRGLGVRSRKKSGFQLRILPRSKCGDIMQPEFSAKVFNFVSKNGIKVLMMDTINPLSPQIDDNKAQDVNLVFLNFLKRLSDDYGVCVLFLHHTDKAGKNFLGSVKWKANCDNVFRIERVELAEEIALYNEKNRQGESNTLKIRIDAERDKTNPKNIIKTVFSVIGESAPEIFVKKAGRKAAKRQLAEEEIKKIISKKPKTRAELVQEIVFDKFSVRLFDECLKKFKKNDSGEYFT